tara:strand:- start:211 stop:312 length:102 start_codon:yes stop_codon:yes gene_type:complete
MELELWQREHRNEELAAKLLMLAVKSAGTVKAN